MIEVVDNLENLGQSISIGPSIKPAEERPKSQKGAARARTRPLLETTPLGLSPGESKDPCCSPYLFEGGFGGVVGG
jgi:hypothetical protein